MPALIRHGTVVEDDCTILPKDFNQVLMDQGRWIVPLAFWLAHAEAFSQRPDIGVWLDSDDAPEELEAFVDSLQLIAINFPRFTDGRGYTSARILRERCHYRGELRAIGDVLQDQLFYMKRCGFDAFSIRADKDPHAALAGMNVFRHAYQGATDNPTPLFRIREDSTTQISPG
jgi:uncharacterized protein (DUF934 family)